VLESFGLISPNPPTVLILIHPAFPSFHTSRSQGGHNGGFHGPSVSVTVIILSVI
jgi:hypothetical protein